MLGMWASLQYMLITTKYMYIVIALNTVIHDHIIFIPLLSYVIDHDIN